MNIKKMQQSIALPGRVTKSKVLTGSVTIIGTSRQNHKKCIQGVLQFKVHQGSVAIKSTARECHNLSTPRSRHYQEFCQGTPQSKILSGSAEILHIQRVQQTEVQQRNMTTRKCNMQMYYQCMPQSKTFQGSITIESTTRTMNRAAREYYNQKYFQECHNQQIT